MSGLAQSVDVVQVRGVASSYGSGVEPRAHQVQKGRQCSLAQSSAPDRRDAKATGGEPPRYRRGAGVSVTGFALEMGVVAFETGVRTQKKSCSSDSRFRRKLSGTTGHRLLGTQRMQMLCGAAGFGSA